MAIIENENDFHFRLPPISLSSLSPQSPMPFPNPDDRLRQWRAAFQSHGYRLTAARQAVMRVLAESNRALDATQILQQARREAPRLGLVTVYRTLEAMLALGLAQKVHCAGQCATYVAAEPGHTHLLVCRRCGRVWYFGGDDLAGLMQNVAAESGFQIEDHWLQLVGLCASCRRALAEKAAPAGADAPCGSFRP